MFKQIMFMRACERMIARKMQWRTSAPYYTVPIYDWKVRNLNMDMPLYFVISSCGLMLHCNLSAVDRFTVAFASTQT